ncbi:MAG: TRAM domain-containing protein [Candidatus Omnitrophota bacterium]
MANKQLTAEIYSLAFGGDGIGKLDGKICFVSGALPGEKVVFEVKKETHNYTQGKTLEILEPSGDRVEPVCPHYAVCGGCQLQHISYEKELFYKKEQILDIMRRIGKVGDIECGDITGSDKFYNYRTSITLHKGGDGYGFYALDNRTVVRIDNCPLAEESINRELPLIHESGTKPDVTVKSDRAGKVWVSDRFGDRFFPDIYRGVELFMSPKAFSQANRFIAEELVATLDEWIGDAARDTVLFDLYCGAGFFTFLLSGGFSRRIGIDSSRVAIDCAKTTLRKQASPGSPQFYMKEAEKEFPELFARKKGGNNILLLDPPRAGMEKKFLENISESADISGIYYISCDPARLARDINVIMSGGRWKIGRVKPFDMFPRTKHIETIAELVKA